MIDRQTNITVSRIFVYAVLGTPMATHLVTAGNSY